MLKILRDFTRKLNVSITCTHRVSEKVIICPFPLDQKVFLRSHCTYTISPLIGYDNFIVWFVFLLEARGIFSSQILIIVHELCIEWPHHGFAYIVVGFRLTKHLVLIWYSVELFQWMLEEEEVKFIIPEPVSWVDSL